MHDLLLLKEREMVKLRVIERTFLQLVGSQGGRHARSQRAIGDHSDCLSPSVPRGFAQHHSALLPEHPALGEERIRAQRHSRQRKGCRGPKSEVIRDVHLVIPETGLHRISSRNLPQSILQYRLMDSSPTLKCPISGQ